MQLHSYIAALPLFFSVIYGQNSQTAPVPPPLGTPTCLQELVPQQTLDPVDVNIATFSMLRILGCPSSHTNGVLQISEVVGDVVNANQVSSVLDSNHTVTAAIRNCDRIYQMYKAVTDACIRGKTGAGGFVEDGEVGAIIAFNPASVHNPQKRSIAKRRRGGDYVELPEGPDIDPNRFSTMTRPDLTAVTSPPSLMGARLHSNDKRQVASTTTSFEIPGVGEFTATWRSFQTALPVYVDRGTNNAVQNALSGITSLAGAGSLGPTRSGWLQESIASAGNPGGVFMAVQVAGELSPNSNQPVLEEVVRQVNSLLLTDWTNANQRGQSASINIMEWEVEFDGDVAFSGEHTVFAVTPDIKPPRNNLLIDITSIPTFIGWGHKGPIGFSIF